MTKIRTIATGIRTATVGKTVGGSDLGHHLFLLHPISRAIVRTVSATAGVQVNLASTAIGIAETRTDRTGIVARIVHMVIGTEAIRAGRSGIVEILEDLIGIAEAMIDRIGAEAIQEDLIGVAMTPLAPLQA